MRERLRSIDHLFEIWGHPLAPRTFGALGVVTGAAILGFCLVHVRRNPSRRELLTWIFSLFAVWAVLFGPATETCTYVLAAPAVAWTLIAAFRRSGAWVARAVLVLSLLMMGPLVTDLLGQTVRNFANAHGSQPVGGLLFLAYLLAKTIQQCIRAALPRAECDFTSVDQNVMTAE
jgi:hypothetical protein